MGKSTAQKVTRWGDVDEKSVDAEIKSMIPKNTQYARATRIKQFEAFCAAKNFILNKRTSVPVIAKALKSYAYNMRKEDGSNYKEAVVKTYWDSAASYLKTKYYTEYKRKIDPFHDIEFEQSRNARDSMRRSLQCDPAKRIESSPAFTLQEFERMVRSWNEKTPEGLQRKFFLLASKELAWRGNEAAMVMVHHFQEELNNSGRRTGRFTYNPVFSKTNQGGSKPLASDKWLIPNTKKNMCPVRILKEFLKKRPSVDDSRLFLHPNPSWRSAKAEWYTKKPISKVKLAKWTQECAMKIGLKNAKFTNHSLRSTAVTHLANAQVPEEQILLLTGHATRSSIQPYLKMHKDRHKDVVMAMRSGKGVPK